MPCAGGRSSKATFSTRATRSLRSHEHSPVAVIHFAASAYVGESVEDPAKYYRNNVGGTQSLLDACRLTGVAQCHLLVELRHLWHSGRLPIGEGDAAAPDQSIRPHQADRASRCLPIIAAAYGLRYVALRYFNACGADPDGELGEWHDPETHLIPRALMAAAGTIAISRNLSATTTTRRTAPACATTSMSPT